MTYARHLIEQYFQRTGQPRDTALDAAWQYQLSVLRDMITRLEVILQDEGVERPTAERVMRCLLYGAPSVADAELRMQQQQERMIKLLHDRPPLPIDVSGLLGMPPQ